MVIGNPPYGVVNKRQNRGVSIVVDEATLNYYKCAQEFAAARGKGLLNIYRLFIQRSQTMLVKNGVFSEIFPLAYAGDLSAAALRKHMFATSQTLSIDAFPERDDPSKRVFEAAKMSVCILIAQNCLPQKAFRLRINHSRTVEKDSAGFLISPNMITTVDPVYARLPIVGEIEFRILVKIREVAKPLNEASRCGTGELDMTLAKEAFTNNSHFPEMIRGAGVQRYELPKKLSQGKHLFIDERKLKDMASMQRLKESERIVLQGITGVNERWRIKATMARDVYCANSTNYILVGGERGRFLLGILNSHLMNFYFSKFSTNSNVNGYEVDALPVFPPATPTQQAEIAALVDEVIATRAVGGDAEALEAQIDEKVFDFYGLTSMERQIVRGSVK